MNWMILIVPLLKIVYKFVELMRSAKSNIAVSIPSSDKEMSLKYIFQYIGKWYKWGGDDPSGFDCSGLVIEYLKSTGKLPRKYDNTAHGLWDNFKKQRVKKPTRGCLVFWNNVYNTKVIHVEIMINKKLAIGASGGGSKTTSEELAMKHNAFIKVRPISSRRNIAGYIDPFKK